MALPIFALLLPWPSFHVSLFIQARESMDLFDELFESELAIVVPHIRSVVNMTSIFVTTG